MASKLLVMLNKEGIDPLRNRSVREALKRLVKDALEGLASRCPTPVKVCLISPITYSLQPRTDAGGKVGAALETYCITMTMAFHRVERN